MQTIFRKEVRPRMPSDHFFFSFKFQTRFTDCTDYAHYVFTTIDQNCDGIVDFEDFLLGLSILLRGSIDEKLRWIYSLYDVNRDGKITIDEFKYIVNYI